MGSWIQTSNFMLFVINGLIKGEIEKLSGQFLGLIVMCHWLVEVWIQIWDISVILPLSLFHVENHVCLSRGVQVTGVAWQVATRIIAGVGDLVQRIGDGHIGWVLDGRTIKRSCDAMYDLHHTWGDEERGFLGWVSKPWSMVYQWFGLKTTGTVCQWFDLKTTGTVCQWFDLKTTGTDYFGLASKSVATVSPDLASKLVMEGFSVWASKLAATIWWFWSQNYHDGFLVWVSKPSGLRFVGCATKLMGGWRWRGARVEI
jgi:hypothetical protein